MVYNLSIYLAQHLEVKNVHSVSKILIFPIAYLLLTLICTQINYNLISISIIYLFNIS